LGTDDDSHEYSTIAVTQGEVLMRTTTVLAISVAFVLAAWWPLASVAEERPETTNHLSPETFKHFQQVIRADYEFRWRCLPWEINPGEAAQKAAREGKPILTFGGHDGVPLGFE
jgi:hypothetical protein